MREFRRRCEIACASALRFRITRIRPNSRPQELSMRVGLRIPARVLLPVLILFHASSSVAQTTRDATACSALTSLKIPGLDLTITTTEWFAAGSLPSEGSPGSPTNAVTLPAYCRLDGVLDRRTGADGKPYG